MSVQSDTASQIRKLNHELNTVATQIRKECLVALCKLKPREPTEPIADSTVGDVQARVQAIRDTSQTMNFLGGK